MRRCDRLGGWGVANMACILVVIDDKENRAAVQDALRTLSTHKLLEAPDGA